MSGKRTDVCHKTRVENCKGVLSFTVESHHKWAYWCKDTRAWNSTQCSCNK